MEATILLFILDFDGMNKRVFQIITVCVFVLMLLLPTIQAVVPIVPTPKIGNENRALAKFPKVSLDNIEEFPTRFEAFFNDHFPLRAAYIATTFNIKVAQQKSPIKGTIIGKDGFMFASKETKVYTGQLKMSNEEINSFVKILKKRNQILQEKGIKFYVTIIPSSLEIYPEYLPSYVCRTKETQTDILCRMMRDSAAEVNFIYLKECLLTKKSEGQLYRKYDNHWNSLAAYYGSIEIMTMIQKDFPQIEILQKQDFDFHYDLLVRGNLVEPMLTQKNKIHFAPDTIYDVHCKSSICKILEEEKRGYKPPAGFPYPHKYESIFQTDKNQYPKAFIIRDSFWSNLSNFVVPYFRESITIWDNWNYGNNFHLINKEKPDVVIVEIYEPHINNLIDSEKK